MFWRMSWFSPRPTTPRKLCGNSLRARRSEDRFPVEARFSAPVQKVMELTQPPHIIGSGSLPEVKRPGSGFNTHPHLALRLKDQLPYTSTSALCLGRMLQGELILPVTWILFNRYLQINFVYETGEPTEATFPLGYGSLFFRFMHFIQIVGALQIFVSVLSYKFIICLLCPRIK